MATNRGLKQLVNGEMKDYRLPGITGQFRPIRLFRNRDGSMWIGTRQGLLRVNHGEARIFTTKDGLSGDFISRIFEDREGNIWVATTNGLDRFREFAVQTISENEGLSDSAPYSVQADPDGSIWIGTSGGLYRWANGRLTVYGGRSALSEVRQRNEQEPSIAGRVIEAASNGLIGPPHSLGLDDAGRLWVSTADGVFYLEAGKFVRVPGIPRGNVFAIAGDGRGNVWIFGNEGLFCRTSDGAVQQIPLPQFQRASQRSMVPDRRQGGVWLGFIQSGIAYVKDGQVRASYSTANGLGGNRVTHLRFGSDGALWAATDGSLSRIKDGNVTTLTAKNGLPCDEVHWSVEDEDHAVWLYMPCGLVRVENTEFDAWVRTPKHILKTTVFDSSDGVQSVGIYGGYGPHVTKSRDGRIWFTPSEGVSGVSVIDPRHLAFNQLPPPVHIEQVTADGKSYWQNLSGDASSSHPRCLRWHAICKLITQP